MKTTVLLIAQLILTITERHASLVLLLKDGTEQIVLIDAQTEEFGMLLHKHVSAPLVNSGMDLPVLFVQTERHGILTLKDAIALFLQHGMVLLVLFAQEVEFIITLLTNVNALVVKPIMDLYAL